MLTAWLCVLSYCPVTSAELDPQAPTFQLSEPVNYFSTVIGKPTGVNGYEEFTLAGDLSRSVELQKIGYFQNWLTTGKKGRPSVVPVGLSKDSSLTDLNQVKLKACKEIVALVKRGCTKKVFRPGEIADGFSFPQLARFKLVANLLVDCAGAELSKGERGKAASILKDSYHMGFLISEGSLTSVLVGSTVRAISLAGIHRGSQQFSRTAWKEFESLGVQLLALPAPEFKAHARSRMEPLKLAEADLFRGGDAGKAPEDSVIKWWFELLALSTEKKQQLIKAGRAHLAEYYSAVDARSIGPESEWLTPFKMSEAHDPTKKRTAEQEFFSFIEMGVSFDTLFESAAKSLTQLRVLVATARVHQFRFQNGRLPNNLQEALGGFANDPLTNQPFIYQKLSRQEFRIASRGSKKLGRIGLIYTKPKT